MYLHEGKLKELALRANQLREAVIDMLLAAGSGHSAGPLGMADIFAAFYFHILNHNPKKPLWKDRDRLIVSNGHICPIQYATLAYAGYFPVDDLKKLRKIGSPLQGHPHRGAAPGVETTSGPLGSGLAQACGVALAGRLDEKQYRTYCFVSDGEQQEGNTWEAVLFAGRHRLDRLTAVMDRNMIQIDGNTEDIMPLRSLREKYEAFGWDVLEIDGHNIREVIDAVHEAEAIQTQPTMIIAHTIPGKGVSFMEGDYHWHGKPPKDDEAKAALKELRTLGDRISSE